MGIKDKAEQLRDKAAQSGKADEFIDKARDKADKATGGRFDDQIDKGAEMARDAAGKRPDDESGRLPGGE